MKHIINRRKFLGLFGCSCCSLILPSCTTVPITERKQLSLFSETKMNAQAAKVYENFKSKTKLITKGDDLDNIAMNYAEMVDDTGVVIVPARVKKDGSTTIQINIPRE